jgi:hypothetical protein
MNIALQKCHYQFLSKSDFISNIFAVLLFYIVVINKRDRLDFCNIGLYFRNDLSISVVLQLSNVYLLYMVSLMQRENILWRTL